MKKIILTESQKIKLQQYLKEEKNLRMYVFDWDDNILRMPTEVKMEKNEDGKWVPLRVSTEDFAHFRTDPNYRTIPDSFSDFTNNEAFLIDAKKAINNKSFSPSYKKFIESLIYANPFAINTARGHSPNTLKEGVKLFIQMVLSDDEKMMMINNIKRELPQSLVKGLNNKQLIDLYLDEMGEFYPVTSEEFGDRFGLNVKGGASNPENSKKVAIAHFVEKVFKNVEKLIQSGEYTKVSFGFSDDDVKNVKATVELLEDELSKMYPEIHFVIYDTSDGGNKKIVIEKE
jgi:hypothetical protein